MRETSTNIRTRFDKVTRVHYKLDLAHVRPNRRLRRCACVVIILILASVGIALPSVTSAALPDGRIYEQVSPANKNGNVVGNPLIRTGSFGLASADGDSVVFVGSGAMGTSYSSTVNEFVARRSSSGWATSSAIPREQGEISDNTTFGPPLTVVPSSDFSRFLFGAVSPYVSSEPTEGGSSSNIFLSENPAVEPTWIARPTISNPIPEPGNNASEHDYLIVGGTPDFGTVYFTYSGTLIRQDESRAPHVGDGLGNSPGDKDSPWGFYEWNHGSLSEAGVLPNGTLNSFGAIPAAIAGPTPAENTAQNRTFGEYQGEVLDNEVSTDGSRAFFVSPDPVASTVTDNRCAGEGQCTNEVPELYVRETATDGSKSTVLVSRSELPGNEGEPSPSGPMSVENSQHVGATYVYASPDGSQAFFESTDRLTSAAPADSSTKEYDYNVATGTLTYLPGVTGPIVAASNKPDFIFENRETSPSVLDLWTGGAGGGQVKQITQLPEDGSGVNGGRASTDGSVFVFRTNSPLPGGFNNAGGFAQVYRYDVAQDVLDCVSCPPKGVIPSGDANVTYNDRGPKKSNGANGEPMTTLDTRIISENGSRVFFDTPDPLVSQDTNTRPSEVSGNGEIHEYGRDVYEWENGAVHLISSGKSVDDSFLLDSSGDGNDVFFATDYGLVPGDADNAYDVYDARIPRPGDKLSPPAGPCQGDVCQGPPSVLSLLGAPPSAMFTGAGNLAPGIKAHNVHQLTRPQKLARALKACRLKRSERKRRRCVAQARKAYGPATKAKKTTRETN